MEKVILKAVLSIIVPLNKYLKERAKLKRWQKRKREAQEIARALNQSSVNPNLWNASSIDSNGWAVSSYSDLCFPTEHTFATAILVKHYCETTPYIRMVPNHKVFRYGWANSGQYYNFGASK